MWAAAFIVLALLVTCALLFFWLVGERGRWLTSTREFFRQSGFRFRTLHGYIYLRWTPRYVKALFSLPPPASSPQGRKAAGWLADHYHAKVLRHDHARAIVGLERDIPLQDLEQIIPYPVARNIVLNGPPDVVVYECPCRHARAAHCEPTQVCMLIGKPVTDFALEHQPGLTRRLSQAEALELLQAEHERGHLHSAWFKDATLDRFYAICNCCKCCCGGVSTMKQGVPIMTSSGYVAEIDRELCANCDDCIEACPFDALSKNGEGVVRDWERCMGCGVCEVKCATGAVSLVRDERKGIPLDVRALA
ncbi:MAG: 4Fe-4S binding protein [Bryobacteraceae bacterium]